MVSGKAGRETNLPGPQTFIERFDNLAKVVDVRLHFGAHWILKRVPKSTVFERNKKRKKNEKS